MSFTRFGFDTAAFEPGGHPLERKKVCAERPAVLLELAPGFSDPNVCERSHAIYVISGTLELELRDRVERVTAGDGCMLEAGTLHRARNAGAEPLRLFVLSELERLR